MTKNDLRVRLARLESMRDSVAAATAKLRSHRLRLLRDVRIRPGFIYLKEPAPVEFSDRRLPPREHRPPATRILTPNGAALKLYLLGLFEAQMNTVPGMPPVALALRGGGSRVGWTDLLASSAEPQGRGNQSASVTDKKIRQLHSALKRLAAPTVKLVHLPHADRRTGTYEQFQLMDESGVRSDGQNSPYLVPIERERTVRMPATFFLNGWIHVLDDSEIAFLLMIAHKREETDELVRVSSQERILHFGIGPDAYAKHRMLAGCGLVHCERDPDRDEMGRVRRPSDPLFLGLDQFQMLEDGFEKPAMKVVLEALHSKLSRA